MRKVDDEGVTFRSHLDGSTHRFTPEKVMEIEQALGADIAMVLDECPDPLDRAYNEIALARTHRWAERCAAAHTRPDQALFGIVQGGIFPDLRQASARFLSELDLPGYAVGGLAVGETKEQMYATLDETLPALPTHKPRYLMGVGAPEDIVESVARGIDMFDCVLPTRIARNGALFTLDGRINLRNAQYAEDPRPVQEELRLLHLPHLQPGLSAPSVQGQRDQRPASWHNSQCSVYDGSHGQHSCRHRGWAI